ncbi:MAG TPA: hypothetical protein VN915_11490 [Elusimicrobiota bacterium]|nr:hypothetical protein [Elusimicrobiota bacterium]
MDEAQKPGFISGFIAKRRLNEGRTWLMIAATFLVGGAAAGAWRMYMLLPEQAMVHKRYQSSLDIARMYGLQLSYKRAHGTYANDFASLLTVAPDAAELKASLAANVDMNTLTVVGDESRFKIELNVLDGQRTPIKVKGPVPDARPAAAPAALTPAPPPMSADGAPIVPAR